MPADWRADRAWLALIRSLFMLTRVYQSGILFYMTKKISKKELKSETVVVRLTPTEIVLLNDIRVKLSEVNQAELTTSQVVTASIKSLAKNLNVKPRQ